MICRGGAPAWERRRLGGLFSHELHELHEFCGARLLFACATWDLQPGTCDHLRVAPWEAGKVFAQQKPYIGGAGAHEKHDDYITLEARGKKTMAKIGRNRAHEKT